MAQKGLDPRKQPRQKRSRETVDAILEAAARVFSDHGYASGTTNRIAEAAGVSIGSLYEYFPNKDAILVALADRHLQRMLDEVQQLLRDAALSAEPTECLLRSFVNAMVDVHERYPELHRVVFSEAPHPPELHACVLQMEETLAHAVESLLRAKRDVQVADLDTAAHLVVQTVEALTHRFVHHGIHDLSRPAFVEEVVTLLTGYVLPGHDTRRRTPAQAATSGR